MAKANFYPVILAGGRGTRFWPRSRRRTAKQVLALDGDRTMIQWTVARLLPLAFPRNFWVVTNRDLRAVIARQLPQLDPRQVLAEPAARNTAPAIGLLAFILERLAPGAVIGMFPADHVIADEKRFRRTIEKAAQIAARPGRIVVMGISPTRAETGYGYIEAGEKLKGGACRVRRFTEKPNAEKAVEFLAAGNYFWNSGVFVWSARTLVDAMREHLSETAPYLERIAAAYGTRGFETTFAKLYPRCESISIDYAVLEPRSAKGEHSSELYCLPSDFGWNDLGSWSALYEHRARRRRGQGNVVEAKDVYALDAHGNYVYAPARFVAVVGVRDLVVVETDDAMLITTRARAQDVGKVVKHLEDKKRKELL